MGKFKYIFLFLVLFIFSVPSFKAADEYQFYCEYDVIMIREVTEGKGATPGMSFPLKVEVYKDGSTKFYSGSKQLKNGIYAYEIDNSFGSYTIHFNGNDFYKEATRNGTTCPSMTTKMGDTYVNLLFGFDSVSDNEYIPAVIKTKTPVLNSNLNTSDREEINQSVVTVTKTCPEVSYQSSLKYFDATLGIKLETYSNGTKKVIIHNYKDGLESSDFYNNSIGATIRFANYTFLMYGGEEDLLFGSTCPKAEDFYIDEDNTSSASFPVFFITLKKETAVENGRNEGQSNAGLQDGPPSSVTLNNNNLSVVISPERGLCTDYLGSLDNNEYELADLLNSLYFIVKVGSVILVIVLSMYEFASSTTKSKDELMAVVKKLTTRLVILVIILLLPTLIDIVGNLAGVEDILCGIK